MHIITCFLCFVCSDKTSSVTLMILCDRTYLTTKMLDEKMKNIPESEMKATFPLPVVRKADSKPKPNDEKVI